MEYPKNDALAAIYKDIKGELVRASVDPKHPCRYLSLSTVGTTGLPESRYIVLRKFLPESSQLIFFTDHRSKKVKELQGNNSATVLGYHPRQKYQLRLKGTCDIDHDNDLAAQYYQREVRQTKDYNSRYAPGTPVSFWQEGDEQKDEINEEHFSIITFKIKEIDLLKLDGKNGHQRARYILADDQSISSTWLVP